MNEYPGVKMPMFVLTQWAGRGKFLHALAMSCVLHAAVLGFLIHRGAPAFVVPSDVQQGIAGSSGSLAIVYLAPVGPEQNQELPQAVDLRRHLSPPTRPEPRIPIREGPQPTHVASSEVPQQTARGGSPYGRVPGSPMTGDEVLPALPEVFPDPPVSRNDLPAGVEGDVIVEVTIDARGNVIETKLLQGIGYGIEEKVLRVLQQWRFRPAMRNGVTIASQHIVHFHYPS